MAYLMQAGEGPGKALRNKKGGQIQVKRWVDGRIIEVGGHIVYSVALPDWDLVYIKYKGMEELTRLRAMLVREGVTLVKVTDGRIYFDWWG